MNVSIKKDRFLTDRIRSSRLVAVNIAYLYLLKLRNNDYIETPIEEHGKIIKSISHDLFMSYRYFMFGENAGEASKVDENFVVKLVYNIPFSDEDLDTISKTIKDPWTVETIDLKVLAIILVAYKEYLLLSETVENCKAILTSEYVKLTSKIFKHHNGVVKFSNGILDNLFSNKIC